MTFTDEEIVIEPGHETRRWQSCNYRVGDTHLFHERAYIRTLPPRPFRGRTPAQLLWFAADTGDHTEQWLPGLGSKAQIEALARKIGGTAHAIEEFYHDNKRNPPHFLAFSNTDEALAFCRTEDFDRLCLPYAKIES